MEMKIRPRRLRTGSVLRKMARETRVSKSSLIYPMFVTEGENVKEEIASMPGQFRWSIDRMGEKLEELSKAGVPAAMFFGIPAQKDERGSEAYAEDGIVQRAFRKAKKEFPGLYLIGDVCMCEYTSHGHCGILRGQDVDNDATLSYLADIAVSQARAGADMVAAFGDRKTYQMDFHNAREAQKEALLDIEEGADIVMVKPAMAYGDLIWRIKSGVNVPVAAYSVSGEYAMVKAAARACGLDEETVMCEMAVCAYRAGTDFYLTYFAKELAECMDRGVIG